jgi:hypothetical protein
MKRIKGKERIKEELNEKKELNEIFFHLIKGNERKEDAG